MDDYFWLWEYYVDSVGVNEEIIRGYVKHQGEKAKEDTERRAFIKAKGTFVRCGASKVNLPAWQVDFYIVLQYVEQS